MLNGKELVCAVNELQSLMCVPARNVTVAVIENDPGFQLALLMVLMQWQNINVHLVLDPEKLTADEYRVFAPAVDLVLLDHDIRPDLRVEGLNGRKVAALLRAAEFSGPIGSISRRRSKVVDYADAHFDQKHMVSYGSREAVRAFIVFMNELLEAVPDTFVFPLFTSSAPS